MIGRVFTAHDSSGTPLFRLTLGPKATRLEQQCRVALYYGWTAYGPFCKQYMARHRWSPEEACTTADTLEEINLRIGVERLVERAYSAISHWATSPAEIRTVWLSMTRFFTMARTSRASVISQEIRLGDEVFVDQELCAGSVAHNINQLHAEAMRFFHMAKNGGTSKRRKLIGRALDHLTMAHQVDPDNPTILNDFGVVLGTWATYQNVTDAKRIYEQVEEALEKALALNRNFYKAAYNLGTVRWRHALLCAGEEREELINKTRSAFETALSIKHGDPDTLYNLGTALGTFALGERFTDTKVELLSEAVDLFRELLNDHPDYADARYNLVRALELLSRLAAEELRSTTSPIGSSPRA